MAEIPSTRSWRFVFDDYATMRRFLDELASVFEEHGYYPNQSFHRTDVTVTVDAASVDGDVEGVRAVEAALDGFVARGVGRSDGQGS